MQLLVADVVRGRLGRAVDGGSALREGLVYRRPLAAGHQTLGGIVVFGFTDESEKKNRTNDGREQAEEFSDILRVSNLLSTGTSFSLGGWLQGVGEDELGLGSSAGETPPPGLVVANSSTNCSMSARGYLAGPEP